MSPLTGKQTITSNTADDTSVKPIEKEILQSTSLAKGIHFFSDQCIIRVANTLELRQRVYEYIYKIYSKIGYANNGNSNLRFSIFDALPDTTTLLAEDSKGNIEGVLTLVSDSPIGLPSERQYKEEICQLRSEDRKIIEIISFGIERSKIGSVRIMAGLFYCAYLIALHLKASTDFIINVIPKHSDFYCKKLLFQKIGKQKPCPRINGNATELLNVPLFLPKMLEVNRRIFPLFLFKFSIQQEIEISKKLETMLSPMSDEEFYTFFIEKSDRWEKANSEQKDYIKRIYPPDQVDHVGVSRALAKAVAEKNRKRDDIKVAISKAKKA